MKIDVGKIPVKTEIKENVLRRPAWYKAKKEELSEYYEVLDAKLKELETTDGLQCNDPNCSDAQHKEQTDNYVLDILSSLIETSYATIPLSGGGGRKWDPDMNCPIGKAISGWNEQVKPFRDDSIFWHNLWQSAGRPNKGVLFSIMTRTRNKYHYVVRRVKKQVDHIGAKNILEASEKGDVHLLKEMKNLKSSKSTASLPESVEDADNPEDIVNKFRTVYSTLYNSAPSAIQELWE